MTNIEKFFAVRGVSENIKEAFMAYIRSDYARKYSMKNDGETSKLVIGKMNEEELRDVWQEFVLEMAKYIQSRV